MHIRASELTENLPINKTQTAILAVLQAKPETSYDELAERIGKTRETVRVNLRKLEHLGLIARMGSRKSGCWVFKG